MQPLFIALGLLALFKPHPVAGAAVSTAATKAVTLNVENTSLAPDGFNRRLFLLAAPCQLLLMSICRRYCRERTVSSESTI